MSEEKNRLEIAKKIADDFDLHKKCLKVACSELGYQKQPAPHDNAELDKALELYLEHFSKILKVLDGN